MKCEIEDTGGKVISILLVSETPTEQALLIALQASNFLASMTVGDGGGSLVFLPPQQKRNR